jgi:phage host-nuclease inhibitor protein Gam
MQEMKNITTGMAEVSVKEIVALEKSVSDKDQTIGALQQQVAHLEQELKNKKTETDKVIVVKKKLGSLGGYSYDEYGDKVYRNSTPEGEEIIGYRNLDTVIEGIRKEEVKKLGTNVASLEKQLTELNIEKNKLKLDYEYKLRVVEDDLRYQKKNNEKDVNDAKERIRKHMTELIDGLNEEIEKLQDELRKVKKDKTDEAVEEARKQEIIDLKNRIAELEAVANEKPAFGWFKTIIYNWLNVDARAKIQAERENLEKQARVEKISREYPSSKNWWAPSWLSGSTMTWSW